MQVTVSLPTHLSDTSVRWEPSCVRGYLATLLDPNAQPDLPFLLGLIDDMYSQKGQWAQPYM